MKFLAQLRDPELRLITALLTVLVVLFLYRMARRGLQAMANAGHFRPVMEQRLTRILRWLTLFVLLLVVVQELGIIKNAWAVLSAVLATLAIGFFALWSVLANVVCAILIVALRPFRVGDHLELLESGVNPPPRGRVLDMNLIYTTLEDVDDSGEPYEINVPNSWFFQKLVRKRRSFSEPASDARSRSSFFGDQLSLRDVESPSKG
jgi:small-conductance mechanosensitive channel